VGEIWDDAKRWLQGDQFDAVMNYVCTNACVAFFPAKHLNLRVAHQQSNYRNIHHSIDAHEFANRIDHVLNIYRPEITQAQLNLLDSHDTPRFLSIAHGDTNSLKLAWLFLTTIPGAPSIYYGDEIGLDGEHDPDCRKAFPWDERKWDKDLFQYAKDVITLRKKNPALRRGDFKRLWSADGVYVYSRSYDGKTFVVALNVSESPQQVQITIEAKRSPKPVFGEASEISLDERLRFTIPARSGVLLK
jgi:neopullulanase